MDKVVNKFFVALLSAVIIFGILPSTAFGQPSNEFTTSWTLDPNDAADLFPFDGFVWIGLSMISPNSCLICLHVRRLGVNDWYSQLSQLHEYP